MAPDRTRAGWGWGVLNVIFEIHAMTTIVKRTTTRKELTALLKGKQRRRRMKGVDVKSFAGKLKLEGDPLEIQKRMRDGWK